MAVRLAVEHDTAFRAPALELGLRLVREAVWHADRCTWFGDDVIGEGEVIYRSSHADLYGGTSGIGWFLANLWAATGEDGLAATAGGALRHALSRTTEASDVGLYTGSAGVALAAVTGGALIGDGAIVEEAASLARLTARTAVAAPGAESDLIGGLAGSALALVELSRALEDEEVLAAAGALGERLRDRFDGDVRAWERGAGPSEPPLCGLGHGASGVALALFELGASLGDRAFDDAACRALDYERRWFSREHGNWPDLRELDRSRLDSGAMAPYLVYWCHGAAGIGLVRLRVHERTGDESWLAEAAAAIDTASATMLRALATEDGTPAGVDLSLCHGVGSVAELHLAAAETTGDDEHVLHARRLVRLAVSGRHSAGDELQLPEELPCGVPGGGETPGLLVGLAGIGALLLRLEDPAHMPSPVRPVGWAS